MDINMTPDSSPAEDETPRSTIWSRLRRLAVFAAPLLVIVAGVFLSMLLNATRPQPEEKADAPNAPAVQFAVAHARPTIIAIDVQGEARPRVEATLAAQVAGRIVWASPAFADGGAFREGDVLARIDDADYQLAVVRARSQVAQSEEGLAREVAEAELARQDWEALGRGEPPPLAVREPQLALARAALAAAQASLRAAELDLSRTAIRAPFSGRIRERRVNVGDYVAPGAPVAVAFATDAVEIRVPLTDAQLQTLRVPVGFMATGVNPGPIARISSITTGRELAWEGRLVRVEASIDSRTRLVYGIVQVVDPFNARHAAPLAPGMFVGVRLEGSGQETLVAAPRSALKRNEFIYVVTAENTISIRRVRPVQTTDEEVLLREGVADGERVVVSVLTSPREGMPVTPIDRDGAAVVSATPLEIRD
jgi:RND family efflux transporter MFP subunit